MKKQTLALLILLSSTVFANAWGHGVYRNGHHRGHHDYSSRHSHWVAPALVGAAVVGTGAYLYNQRSPVVVQGPYYTLPPAYNEVPAKPVVYYCASSGLDFPQAPRCAEQWQILPANPYQ